MTIRNIAVLVTVYNRAEVTERGLRRLSLYAEMLKSEFNFFIFLVDDGSADDTSARVRTIPLHTKIIEGTGNLYWNRGMALAYRSALESGIEFDAYMLYNDDIVLNDEFCDFMRCFQSIGSDILVGAFTEPGTVEISYSGFVRLNRHRPLSFVKPVLDRRLVPVDTFNGNLVMIPATVFNALNGMDPLYTHAYGDIDLGLRAKAIGSASFVYGFPIGYCAKGSTVDRRLEKATFRQRWELLFAYPHGLGSYMRFSRKHGTTLLLPFYAVHETCRRAAKLFRVR